MRATRVIRQGMGFRTRTSGTGTTWVSRCCRPRTFRPIAIWQVWLLWVGYRRSRELSLEGRCRRAEADHHLLLTRGRRPALQRALRLSAALMVAGVQAANGLPEAAVLARPR